METGTANLPPRRHHIRDDKWRRVDSRAIIIGTRLEKTNGAKQGKEPERFQINETQQAPGELKDHIVPNDLEYADDTQILIDKDTHEKLCERIGNYDIAMDTMGKGTATETQRTKTNGAISTSFLLI